MIENKQQVRLDQINLTSDNLLLRAMPINELSKNILIKHAKSRRAGIKCEIEDVGPNSTLTKGDIVVVPATKGTPVHTDKGIFYLTHSVDAMLILNSDIQ